MILFNVPSSFKNAMPSTRRASSSGSVHAHATGSISQRNSLREAASCTFPTIPSVTTSFRSASSLATSCARARRQVSKHALARSAKPSSVQPKKSSPGPNLEVRKTPNPSAPRATTRNARCVSTAPAATAASSSRICSPLESHVPRRWHTICSVGRMASSRMEWSSCNADATSGLWRAKMVNVTSVGVGPCSRMRVNSVWTCISCPVPLSSAPLSGELLCTRPSQRRRAACHDSRDSATVHWPSRVHAVSSMSNASAGVNEGPDTDATRESTSASRDATGPAGAVHEVASRLI
eukprot:3916300-Prymnesium_polylepis.3